MEKSGVARVAGVVVEDEEELMGLVHTIVNGTIPIMREDGSSYVPADDLTGAVAEQLGLSRDDLTDQQRAEIGELIFWANTTCD